MYAQNRQQLFVYDVKRGGECACHYVVSDGVVISVGIDTMARPKGYFAAMKRMHEMAGHQMVLKLHAEDADIWAVEIGGGDFSLMVACLNETLDIMIPADNRRDDENTFNLN